MLARPGNIGGDGYCSVTYVVDFTNSDYSDGELTVPRVHTADGTAVAVDCTIYWGDGTSDYVKLAENENPDSYTVAQHTYTPGSKYKVRIVSYNDRLPCGNGLYDPATTTNAGKSSRWNNVVVGIDHQDNPINTARCKTLDQLFSYTANLKSSNIKGKVNTQSALSLDYMFSGSGIDTLSILTDTSKVTSITGFCAQATSILIVPCNFSNVVNAKAGFDNCTSLQSFQYINFGKTTTGDYMFRDCVNLNGLPSQFNALISGTHMFEGCTGLNELSWFDSLLWGDFMFTNCTGLQAILDDSFTSLRTAEDMFLNCKNISGTVSCLFPALSQATRMFGSCSAITGFSDDAFPEVTHANYLFSECTKLAHLRSTFSKVAYAQYMFNNCTSMEYESASAIVPTALQEANYMFNGCTYIGQLHTATGWGLANLVSAEGMFKGCKNLKSLPTSFLQSNNGKLGNSPNMLSDIALTNFDGTNNYLVVSLSDTQQSTWKKAGVSVKTIYSRLSAANSSARAKLAGTGLFTNNKTYDVVIGVYASSSYLTNSSKSSMYQLLNNTAYICQGFLSKEGYRLYGYNDTSGAYTDGNSWSNSRAIAFYRCANSSGGLGSTSYRGLLVFSTKMALNYTTKTNFMSYNWS